MAPFEVDESEIVESMNKDEAASTEGAEAPEERGLEAKEQETQDQKPIPQEILDLAKVGKFKVDGQELTYEDLRKAMLRQQDYTKKTQALAEERKYYANLSVDLKSVRKDPRLAAEFKKVYPEEFHGYLDLILAQDRQAKAEGEAPSPQLPPEIVEKIERQEQLLSQLMEQSNESTRETLDAMYTSLEQDVQTKFPRADMVHVYGAIENYIAEQGLTSKDLLKNKAATQKMFETFAKASHDKRVSDYEAWRKEELKKSQERNQKAGDIGKGGGTPVTAPAKVRMKDVADQWIASMENQQP